jgi:enoyl-CoA hydratase/carnithine racemase
VLIITGAGDRAFCAGADLTEMAGTQMRVPPKNLFIEFNRTLKTDKPIIAAVNGHAFAGGFRIAQMTDLVISADHATFAISEPEVGRGAPWASPLARIVGPRIALELLTTAQSLTAQRMYDLGFVNRVVSFDELLPAAEALARAIADNAPCRSGPANAWCTTPRRSAGSKGSTTLMSSGSTCTSARTARKARGRLPRSASPSGRVGRRSARPATGAGSQKTVRPPSTTIVWPVM